MYSYQHKKNARRVTVVYINEKIVLKKQHSCKPCFCIGAHFSIPFQRLYLLITMLLLSSPVDKLLSNEDGGGIFDEPATAPEPVPLPTGPADDEDDFDNFSRKFPQFI